MNAVAATNNIIMVYPDSRCWDNHGDIDSSNYLTKEGLYPQIFKMMICRLTAADADSMAADCPKSNSAYYILSTALAIAMVSTSMLF